MIHEYLHYSLIVVIVCCLQINEGSILDWKAHTSKYGEACVNHDQCVDFRMICSETKAVCECDEFHDWTDFDRYRSECILNVPRLRSFLASQEETRPNYEDNLSEEAHNLFLYLGLSGIMAISLGVVFTLACVVFVFTNSLSPSESLVK